MIQKIRTYIIPTNIAIAIIAIILLQTLPFKFLGLPESVQLFTAIEQEPRGRIGSGIIELLATIGLFFRYTRPRSAFTIIGLMLGALYFHATVLGRDALAVMAFVVLVCAIFIASRSVSLRSCCFKL